MALKSNKQKPATQFYSDFVEKFHNREVTKNYYKTIPLLELEQMQFS